MADSREFRSRFYISSIAFVGILFGILVAFYFLGGVLTRAKVDLTEDGLFTISTPMAEILKDLKDEINVRYYCTEELPSQIANLKRDTMDIFRELEGLSNGHFKWEVVDPQALAERDAQEKVKEYYEKKQKGETPKEPQRQESFEELFMGRGKTKRTDEQIAEDRRKVADARAAGVKGGLTADEHYRRILLQEYKDVFLEDLRSQGIQDVSIQERSANQVAERAFFSALEIKYLNKQAEVIPQHFRIENLEYEMASKVLKLARASKPKVVFFDSRKPDVPFNPSNPMARPPQSDYSGIIGALSELFDIDEVSLKENSSISDTLKRIQDDLAKKDDDRPAEEKPTKISCLVVAQPSDLEARQVFEISKAVSEGIPTIFLVSNYSIDVSAQGLQEGFPIVFLRHGLDELFRSWGVNLGKDILASRECASFAVPQRVPGLGVIRAPYPLPVLLSSIGDAINQQHGLTTRIRQLVFPASVGLTVVEEEMKKAGLSHTVLARTGKEAYTVNVPMFEQDMFQRPQKPAVLKKKELFDRREVKSGYIEPKALAVIIEGKFPFKYQDQPVPEWRKEEKKDPNGGGPPNPLGGLNFPGLGDDHPKGPRGPSDNPAEGNPQPAQTPPAAEKKAEAAPPSPPAQPPVQLPPVAVPPAATPPAGAAPATPAAGTPVTPPAPVAPATPPAGDAATPAMPGAEAKKEDAKKEPEKAPEKAKIEVKDGRVILLTSADMLKTEFLQGGGEYQHNVNFFYNAIETFGLDDRLLKIRRKELTLRQFKANAENWATFIQWTNIAILPLAVGAFGLVRYLVRRGQSVAYEREYIQRKASGTA